MNKLLTLLVVSTGLFTSVSFAQDVIETPKEPVDQLIMPLVEDEELVPEPFVEYNEELERIRDLSLQDYATEIADIVVANLEQQKVWEEVMQEFLERATFLEGRSPEIRDITVPEKEEVIAYVFTTVEELGGLNAAEAKVGIVVDEVAGTLYAALVGLPFTEAQREVLYLPSLEYLTEEQIANNVLHAIKNRALNHFDAYSYFPYPLTRVDYGDGIGDGEIPLLEDGTAGYSPIRSNVTKPEK